MPSSFTCKFLISLPRTLSHLLEFPNRTMQSAITNPLNLPEIQLILGIHLDKIDLAVCILVCKSWSNTLGPLLYSCLDLSEHSERRRPSFDLCCTHASRVLDTQIDTTTSPQFLALNFSNLSNLSTSSCSHTNSIQTNMLVEFIQRHRMSLYYLDIDADLPLKFWESLAKPSSFPKLRELSVNGLIVDTQGDLHSSLQDESAAAFWKACTRFKVVALRYLYPDLPDMDCSLTFKYLESLELTQLINPTIAEYMALLSNCPQLQRLSWEERENMSHEILEGMAQLALSGHLQSLRSLDLNLFDYTDSVPVTQSMVKLLNTLKTPLQSLYLNCGQDMEDTTLLLAIKRHVGNLDR